MLCKNCGYRISWLTQTKDNLCILCGTPMMDTVDDIFANEKYGIIKEKRKAQLDYATDIQNLFLLNEKGIALMEGGTGIGKSYAYLIPAILTDKRIVISTATKALQDQLAIDIPILLKKMGSQRKFTVYKGKKNYACRLAAKNIRNKAEQKQFKKWLNKVGRKESPAALTDWPGPKPPWWDSITTEDCPKSNTCEHRSYCRPHPTNYDLIVVNHSILAIDLFLSDSPGQLLNPYSILIIDEGHKAPGYFRKAFTHSLTYKGIRNLRATYTNSTALHTAIMKMPVNFPAEAISQGLAEVEKSIRVLLKFLGCVPNLKNEETISLSDSTNTTLTRIYRDITDTMQHLDILISYFSSKSAQSDLEIVNELDTVLTGISCATRIRRGLDTLSHTVTKLIQANPTTNLMVINEKGLSTQPIDIGPEIAPVLKQVPFKIITSATIKTGKNFDYIREQLGVKTEECVYQSTYTGVFDYNKQAHLYLPPKIPLPAYGGEDRIKWIQALVTEIQNLILGTKGDALVLFTAIKDMEEVWEALYHSKLKSAGLHLLLQGGSKGMDAGSALKEFKKNRGSVLFGVKSLWEGIDLPGDQLRMVIITKLPFPPPSPLHTVLTTRLGASKMFRKITLPLMITDLRQVAGRPIRRQTDRGLIVILDPRIWTGSTKYHHTILKTMMNDKKGRYTGPQGYGKDIIDALGIKRRAKNITEAIAFANGMM